MEISKAPAKKAGSIFRDIMKVHQELNAIPKTQKHYDGYLFRGYDDVINAISPLMKKHKIITLAKSVERIEQNTKTTAGKSTIRVVETYEFTFVARDGSTITTEGKGESMDAKGMVTAHVKSLALKDAYCTLFQISTEEMQNDPEQKPDSIGEAVPQNAPYDLEGIKNELNILKSDPKNAKSVLWLQDYYKQVRRVYPDHAQDEDLVELFAAIKDECMQNYFDEVQEPLPVANPNPTLFESPPILPTGSALNAQLNKKT